MFKNLQLIHSTMKTHINTKNNKFTVAHSLLSTVRHLTARSLSYIHHVLKKHSNRTHECWDITVSTYTLVNLLLPHLDKKIFTTTQPGDDHKYQTSSTIQDVNGRFPVWYFMRFVDGGVEAAGIIFRQKTSKLSQCCRSPYHLHHRCFSPEHGKQDRNINTHMTQAEYESSLRVKA